MSSAQESLSLWNGFSIIIRKQLILDVWVSELLVLIHWLVCLSFVPVPHCLDYCRFVASFEIKKHCSFSVFVCLVSLCYLIWIWGFWHFARDVIDSVDNFGYYCHLLTVRNFTVHKHGGLFEPSLIVPVKSLRFLVTLLPLVFWTTNEGEYAMLPIVAGR